RIGWRRDSGRRRGQDRRAPRTSRREGKRRMGRTWETPSPPNMGPGRGTAHLARWAGRTASLQAQPRALRRKPEPPISAAGAKGRRFGLVRLGLVFALLVSGAALAETAPRVAPQSPAQVHLSFAP